MPHSNTPTAGTWDDIWPTVGEPGLARENIPVRFHIAPAARTGKCFATRPSGASFAVATRRAIASGRPCRRFSKPVCLRNCGLPGL